MAVTARTWVEGEISTAIKMNTLRDDLLALDAIAGIKSVQYGTVTITNGNASGVATITAIVVAKTVLHFLGQTVEAGSAISDGLARITLTNTTTVTATRGSTNNNCIASFCAEEHM